MEPANLTTIMIYYHNRSTTIHYNIDHLDEDTMVNILECMLDKYKEYFGASDTHFCDSFSIKVSTTNIVLNQVSPLFCIATQAQKNTEPSLEPTADEVQVSATEEFFISAQGEFMNAQDYIERGSVKKDTSNLLSPNSGGFARPPPRRKAADNKSTYEFIRVADAAPAPTPGVVTREELARHNTKEDCWMSIEGMVYDVTPYIRYHPGGDKILLGKGKDATALYKKYHPWVNHSALIGKYFKGNLR